MYIDVDIYDKMRNVQCYIGISFANLSNFEEASKAYVQALHLTPGARYVTILICIYKHSRVYLRVVFTSMDKLDLLTYVYI
jgi:hypothetical protein